jgi:hypothetical protein
MPDARFFAVAFTPLTQKMLEEKLPETKICEACDKDFQCSATSEKCWCFEVDLSAETLAKLQKDFKSCLCKDCLLSHEQTRIDTKEFMVST